MNSDKWNFVLWTLIWLYFIAFFSVLLWSAFDLEKANENEQRAKQAVINELADGKEEEIFILDENTDKDTLKVFYEGESLLVKHKDGKITNIVSAEDGETVEMKGVQEESNHKDSYKKEEVSKPKDGEKKEVEIKQKGENMEKINGKLYKVKYGSDGEAETLTLIEEEK